MIIVKALVRWAIGERLTNRLPKLIVTTLSPPSEQRDVPVQTQYTGRRVTHTRFKFMGTESVL